jgi:hypothetical protein
VAAEMSDRQPKKPQFSTGVEHRERIRAGQRRVKMLAGGRMDEAPPWMVHLMDIDREYEDARDRLDRMRARRALATYLAYRYFGASQRWIGEKLKMPQPHVNRLIKEGELVAAKSKHARDLESLIEVVYSPDMVRLGWDGARR